LTSIPHTMNAPTAGRVPGMAVAVLNTVGLACAVVERATHRVVWMSDRLSMLSGLVPADVVGATVDSTLLDPSSAALATGCWADGPDGPGAVTFQGSLTAADGAVPVAWTVSPLAEESANEHVLLVAVDQRHEAPLSAVFSQVATNWASGVPVLGTDLEGRVTCCSTAMEEFLGRDAEGLLGRTLPRELFDKDRLAERRRMRQSGEGERIDWPVVRPDGTLVVTSVDVRPVSDATGRRVGYLAWALDVTEERLTRDLLVSALDKEREATLRLAELDATRNDFIATASHELRTPVTSIRGYAELMADGDGSLSPREAMFTEAILRNADRLCTLADDLLVLCRMDAEPETLNRAALDVRETVESCTRSARNRGAALDVRLDLPPVPVVVDGDAGALGRVLDHLLGNAVKFTEAGSITCTLRTDDGHAVIEVADTGIGIPEHEQAALFTRFHRSSDAQARALPGSGLGLAVARTLVEAHGGEIALRSAPGVGTTVTVRLPLRSQLHQDGPEVRPHRSAG
jgi:PAS domain S-box-containing protein